MQVGCLAASIAHDMNNLLTVIEGSVGLASEALPPDHPAQRDLATISQAGRRSAAMVRQLLGFIRRQPPLPFPAALGDALAGIRLLVERILERGMALECDIAPDLWLIAAAPGHLDQILINLLTNARDAMPHGGRVRLCARNHTDPSGGEYVRLEVVDTGVGFPPEVGQRLFEPFFTTKDPARAAGLGLTICAAIVEQLGGQIELESVVGQGATARLLLPRAAM